MKIEGAVAIVTGGASGIGKAICEKLLQGGAKVSKTILLRGQQDNIGDFTQCESFIDQDFCSYYLWEYTVGVFYISLIYFFDLLAKASLIIVRDGAIINPYKKIILRFIYSARKVFIINWQRVTITANIESLLGELMLKCQAFKLFGKFCGRL